jgi:hypothetical protein
MPAWAIAPQAVIRVPAKRYFFIVPRVASLQPRGCALKRARFVCYVNCSRNNFGAQSITQATQALWRTRPNVSGASWSARRHALSEAGCLCPRSAVRSRPRGMTGRERAARTRTSTALRRADCGPVRERRAIHYTVGEAGCLCPRFAARSLPRCAVSWCCSPAVAVPCGAVVVSELQVHRIGDRRERNDM